MKIDNYIAKSHVGSFRYRGVTFGVFDKSITCGIYRLRKGGIRGNRSQAVHDFWKAGYNYRDLSGVNSPEALLKKAKKLVKFWYVFEEGRPIGGGKEDSH